MQKGSNAYLQTQVNTTSQGDILVMLYDGAIKFMNRAKDCIAEKDMAGKGNAISRALDIIHELDCTLNMEKGGDLSKNLHNLYLYCNKRLLMANLRVSNEILDEVLTIITGLRSAYAQILTLPEAQAAAQEAAASQHVKESQATRSQVGIAPAGPTGGPTPSVGVGLRARSLYAQKTAELQPTATRNEALAAEQSACIGTPASSLAAQQEVVPVASAAPVAAPSPQLPLPRPASSQAPAPQIPTATDTPTDAGAALVPPALASGGGFAGRRLGADMYRKFAGQ